jgi:hypothetical protein
MRRVWGHEHKDTQGYKEGLVPEFGEPYTLGMRHLVDIGVFAEKEVIQ